MSLPAPTNVTVTNSDSTHGTVSWDSVPGATGYTVRRVQTDGTEVNNSVVSAPSTSVAVFYGNAGGIAPLGWRVATRDASGLGAFSTPPAYVSSGSSGGGGGGGATDTTPPAVPVIQSTSVSGSTATIIWNAISDATTYQVYRNGLSQGTTTNNYWTQTLADGTYTYSVRAADASANWSAQSSTVSVTVSVNPPAVPSNVTASIVPYDKSIQVSWTIPTNGSNFRVYRNGQLIATVNGVNTYNDVVTADGTYYYTVSAGTASGNWSAQSTANSASTVVYDVTPPAVPIISSVTHAGNYVTVSWNSVSGADTYQLFQNGQSLGITGATSMTFYVPDGTYAYTVRAEDASGNWSAQTPPTNLLLDTIPPATPVAPSTPPVTRGNSTTLSWSPTSGASSYEVFRNGVSLGTFTSTSYTDTNLDPGTYTYTIRAYDAAGNQSSMSSSVKSTIDPFGLHAPPAIKTGTPTDLDYSVGQREFEGEDNIRFDRE